MNVRKTTFRKLALATVALTALASASSASAATFGVRVVDPQGQPVSGASVCVGLAGNYSQFGAEFTGADGVVQVDVPDGVPGPRCRAGSTVAEGPGIPRIVVQDIDINKGASLVLRPTVTGSPSEYRIDSDDNFENATWRPYTDSIRVAGSLANESALFLQMRHYAGSSKGWLEARSEVISISIAN